MAKDILSVIVEEVPFSGFSPEGVIISLKRYPYGFFLDSAGGPSEIGRFSFFGCDPFLVFKSKKDRILTEWQDGSRQQRNGDPFLFLKGIFRKFKLNSMVGLPFSAGGVGYFGYDLKDFVEDLDDIAVDDLGIPDCIVGFYDTVFVVDSMNRRCYVVSSGFPEMSPKRNGDRARARLNYFKDIFFAGKRPDDSAHPVYGEPDIMSNFSKRSYMKAVEAVKRHIKRGDVYQVNLSQRFSAPLSIEPDKLYLRLRSLSPMPFASYLDFKDVIIASSSPERFLMKRGSYLETRPIKGTRPRSEISSMDTMLEKELVNSAKDRAEHIMIVDLERNDLGRVCDYGTVVPTESMVLERYSNVFHLVSTVSGIASGGVTPIDCLKAMFPGGSITGAPKIRSMQIIEELEPCKRSVYTGAIGYVGFDGNMDTSIAIRTLLVKAGKVFFSVGGGIVADSDPEMEYDETIHKAKGMLRALGAEAEKEYADVAAA